MAVRREVKVGAFMLAGLIALGTVIFMIGDERQLFERKVDFRTNFEDVKGLNRGSAVRMGGVDVGSVKSVGYSDDPGDPKLYVTVTVVRSQAARIRRDSVATIDAKGLLGDKMIVITLGSLSQPALNPGDVIKSEAPQDFTQALSKLGEVSAHAEKVVANLEKTTGQFADPQFTDDLKSTAHSMAGILKSLDEGNGYAARLLRDEKEADKLSRTMTNVEHASAELSGTANHVNAIVGRVEKGPGFAHDVLYGEGPSNSMAQIGGAADELRLTLKGIRENKGIAHSVLYGGEGSDELMANLNSMSKDLKQITSDLKAGKGTLGALLVDPSVYEDIKLVLGNVGRNKALRALVRYSIQRDEKVRGVEIRDPEPASAGGSAREASAPKR